MRYSAAKFAVLCALAVQAVSFSAQTDTHLPCWDVEPTKYDVAFLLAARLTELDACKLKAQALTENSTLDPKAKSRAGAMGCTQFLPSTWKDIAARYDVSHWRINDCVASIFLQALYMREHYDFFLAQDPTISEDTAWEFALAAYNRGRAGFLRSVGGKVKNLAWDLVKDSQPVETAQYVRKIQQRIVLWSR